MIQCGHYFCNRFSAFAAIDPAKVPLLAPWSASAQPPTRPSKPCEAQRCQRQKRWKGNQAPLPTSSSFAPTGGWCRQVSRRSHRGGRFYAKDEAARQGPLHRGWGRGSDSLLRESRRGRRKEARRRKIARYKVGRRRGGPAASVSGRERASLPPWATASSSPHRELASRRRPLDQEPTVARQTDPEFPSAYADCGSRKNWSERRRRRRSSGPKMTTPFQRFYPFPPFFFLLIISKSKISFSSQILS